MTLLMPLLYALLAFGEVDVDEGEGVEVEEEDKQGAEIDVVRTGRGSAEGSEEREVVRVGIECCKELEVRGKGERGESSLGGSSQLRSMTSTSFSSISMEVGNGVFEEMVGASRSARFLSPTIMDATDCEGM